METTFIKEVDTNGYFDLNNYPKVTGSENCQCLGLSVYKTKKDKIRKSDYNKFLNACKKVIESDIFEGVLSMGEFDLVSIDVKRNVTVNKDGTKAIITLSDWNDKSIAKKSDILYRAVLFFYFKSKINKEELNNKFGNIFIDEGAVPDLW